MRHLCPGLITLVVLLLISPAQAETVNIGDLFSTGVDDSEAPVEAYGVMDTHWEVQVDELGWVTPLFERTNFCTSCGSIWLPHPAGDDSLARPLAHPDHVQVIASNRKFSWRTSFTIPDTADPSTATITYRLGFDDVSRNSTDTGNLSGCNHTVWLNGTPYELASTGTNIRTECEATIAAGSAFVTGENKLEFRIQNLATYYGFRLEKLSATYEEELCGNGELDDGEACDDGNDIDSDGCDATCAVEDGYSCAQEASVGDLFSTGVDDSEAPVEAYGVMDTHWEVQENELGWVTPLFERTNFCTSCGSIWLPHPAGDDSLARPLAHPDHVQVIASNRKFSWRTSFTIPDTADPSTATITYRLGFDDVSRNSTDTGNLSGCNHTVWLNGTPYELASTGTNIRTECEATIAAGSAFVTGENKLEFRIQNLATYYGFRLEKLSATYQGPSVCTPLCGNSMLDNNESCDDGNDTDSDGCNTSCEIEDGWGCEGEPSVCELLCGDGALDAGEVCDDGNDTDSDGCNTSCEIEDGWGL